MVLLSVANTNVLNEQQFERLFQFAQKVENLLYTISPEEMPFQLGYSKMDLRKTLKASLSGVRSLTSSLENCLVHSMKLHLRQYNGHGSGASIVTSHFACIFDCVCFLCTTSCRGCHVLFLCLTSL